MNLFDDNRKYKVEEKNGEEWKEFESEHRADVLKMESLTERKPIFEETMMLDTIRAIRRDKKEAAKKK